MGYISNDNKNFLENWNNLFEVLPDNKLTEVRSSIKRKSYNQAEEISSYGDICPGLIRVKSGKIRCIFENKSSLILLFTYKQGDILGAEHILSDIQEQTLVTSNAVDLEILPSDLFLNLLKEFPLLYKKFINTSVPEIFSCIRKSKMYSDFSDMNLLKISKSLFDKNCEIEFNPIFNNSQNEYIASSNNFKNIKKGDLIKTTLDTLNIGKLNTRIIKIPSNFSKRSEIKLKK